MAQLPLPVGKEEFYDGTSWFSLASENWVVNTLKYVAPCLVSTTAALTATYNNGTNGVGATLTNSGTQSALVINGVTLAVNDRVLVKDQSNQSQNGIFTVTNIGSVSTNWILTRAGDYDSIEQITRGGIVSVINGTVASTTLWMLTSIVTSIGVSNFIFASTDLNSFTSILGTTNQITVTVVNGVATIALASDPVLPGAGGVTIPTGTTAQRPVTPTVGTLRLNTSL